MVERRSRAASISCFEKAVAVLWCLLLVAAEISAFGSRSAADTHIISDHAGSAFEWQAAEPGFADIAVLQRGWPAAIATLRPPVTVRVESAAVDFEALANPLLPTTQSFDSTTPFCARAQLCRAMKGHHATTVPPPSV